MRDPRPHVGGPLALDLLNTQWMSADGPPNLLAPVEGVRCWVGTNRLRYHIPAAPETRRAVISAREAIRRAAAHESTSQLNALLDHGRIHRTLTEAGPADIAEVPEPEWLAGWLAADNLLHLLSHAPHRIKQCSHPQCVLW